MPPSEPSEKPPEDKSSYSVQEIIHKLNQSGQDEEASSKQSREVVLREDGTKVVRVRKRKRVPRSFTGELRAQGSFFSRLKKKHILAAVIIFVVLLVAGVGMGFAKFASMNGDSYRQKLQTKIGEIIEADVQFDKMRVDPTSVKIGSASVSWKNHPYLKSLSAGGLVAELSALSFFTSYWKGEALTATQSSLVISPQKGGKISSKDWANFLRFDFLRSKDFSIRFADEKQAFFSLEKSSISCKANLLTGTYLVDLSEGTIVLGDWRSLSLSHGFLSVKGDEFPSISAEFVDEKSKGSITLSGSYSTVLPSDQKGLTLKLNQIPLSVVSKDAFKKLLSGSVFSKEKLPFHFAVSSKTPEWSGPITIKGISFKAFPFMEKLQTFVRRKDYIGTTFISDVQAVVSATAGGFEIKDFSMKDDLLCLKGSIRASNKGTLSGHFEVGVPRAVLLMDRIGPPKTFEKQSDGFFWTTIEIGGTVEEPTDNSADIFVDDKTTILPTTPDKVRSPDPQPVPGTVSPEKTPESKTTPQSAPEVVPQVVPPTSNPPTPSEPTAPIAPTVGQKGPDTPTLFAPAPPAKSEKLQDLLGELKGK